MWLSKATLTLASSPVDPGSKHIWAPSFHKSFSRCFITSIFLENTRRWHLNTWEKVANYENPSDKPLPLRTVGTCTQLTHPLRLQLLSKEGVRLFFFFSPRRPLQICLYFSLLLVHDILWERTAHCMKAAEFTCLLSDCPAVFSLSWKVLATIS